VNVELAEHAEPSERERLAQVAALAARGSGALPELIEALVQPSWVVRRAVVKALSELDLSAARALCRALRDARDDEAKLAGIVDALSLSGEAVEDELLELTFDSNAAVVCDAAAVLGRRGSVRAVSALRRLTTHTDDNVALAAVEALGRVGGTEALESLLELVRSRNFFRTFPTIDVLGRLGDARAVPSLLALLVEPLYAVEAARALARLGDLTSAIDLVEQLARAGPPLACAIARALIAIHARAERLYGSGVFVERALRDSRRRADIQRRLSFALKQADADEQVAVSRALALLGDGGGVLALLELLQAQGPAAHAAAQALRRLAPVAEATLIDALRRAESPVRRWLVPALAGRAAARDEIVRCLEDPDPVVRASSCDALARTSDFSVVGALFGRLSDRDRRVSQAALGAIQSLGSVETERLALSAAKSPNPQLRSAALRIIGYFGYASGLSPLSAAATAEDEREREVAIAGLPLLDDPAAVERLLEVSRHSSARTRAAAMRAMGHLAATGAPLERLREALKDPDPWVRYYASQALGRRRDADSVEAVAELLADPSGQVRVGAVEALAHLPGKRSFEVLKAVPSADPDLYRAAIVALGISRRPEAMPHLLQALESTDLATRLVAVSALGDLDFAGAIPALAVAAEDADEGVRTAASSLLATRADAAATDELLRLIKKEPSRDALIEALARAVPGRVEAIASALADADAATAPGLVAALAHAHTEPAERALRAAFTATNPHARHAAAAALVAMLDPPSLVAIERAAHTDPDPEIRRLCTLPPALRHRA
jgi:HEAT repeat protein